MRFIFIVFALLCAEAKADWPTGMMTGNNLLQYCDAANNLSSELSSEKNIQDAVSCFVFIEGLNQGIAAVRLWAQVSAPAPWCLPKDVTRGQISLVITTEFREKPQFLHTPAGGLAVIALAKAFPCK